MECKGWGLSFRRELNYVMHVLMPTLARRSNNKKKPNNMRGNKEEESLQREKKTIKPEW